MGVLIDDGSNQILIDGLHLKYEDDYLNPPQDLLDSIVKGKGKYNVDVVLFTHVHKDHFNKVPTIEFLLNNKNAVIIAPQQVFDTLKLASNYEEIQERVMIAEQIKEYKIDSETTIEPVKMMHTWPERHSKITNYAYIVKHKNTSAIHIGDAESTEEIYMSTEFKKTKYDVAIVPSWFIGKNTAPLTKKHIKASQFIVTHLSPLENNAEWHLQNSKDNGLNSIAFTVPRQITRIKMK